MHSHSGAKPCLMKLKLSLVKPSWVENLWEKKKKSSSLSNRITNHSPTGVTPAQMGKERISSISSGVGNQTRFIFD